MLLTINEIAIYVHYGGSSVPPKNVSSKNQLVNQNKWGSRKGNFKKKTSTLGTWRPIVFNVLR